VTVSTVRSHSRYLQFDNADCNVNHYFFSFDLGHKLELGIVGHARQVAVKYALFLQTHQLISFYQLLAICILRYDRCNFCYCCNAMRHNIEIRITIFYLALFLITN
jgi:hypothetical protein